MHINRGAFARSIIYTKKQKAHLNKHKLLLFGLGQPTLVYIYLKLT